METDLQRTRNGFLGIAAVVIIAMLAFLALAAPPAEAKKISVHASKVAKRTVTFKLRSVNPNNVTRATARLAGRTRRLSAGTARRAAETGRLRLEVRSTLTRRSAGSTSRRTKRKPRRRYKLIVTATDRAVSGGGTPGSAGGAPAPSSDMLIDPARLASLPTSGDAYDYMKEQADAALSDMNLSGNPDATSPWLPNYNGDDNVPRPAVQTLAAALVYARTGEERYRDFVIKVNRYLIGTETERSTDGTAEQDKLLATSRQIGAFVVAGSLVDMDPALTGSRSGFGGISWSEWLSDLRTDTIGTSGQAANMTELSDERASNWGAFGRAARIAIDIYLGDDADLALVVNRFQISLGERDGDWQPTQDLDLSFSCTGDAWIAINPASCGPAFDGMIVEDISRSSGGYPNYDRTGIGYTMESYQAMLFSAVLLERQGYDAFGWGDQALRRVMDWLTREGFPQGNGTTVERHESWVAQYFYGKSYPTTPALMGRTLGFTDWLFAS